MIKFETEINFEILRADQEGVTGNGREGLKPLSTSWPAFFVLGSKNEG